jgi:hypothetical protein
MAETTTNPEPARTDLEALAAELLQDLRKLHDRIPHFTLPHESHPRLTGIATRVPQAAVDAGFAACGTKEALAKSIDVAATHFDEAYTTAFAELRDELKTTYRGLDYTIRLKRFSVGQAMLRVLNIARRLAKSAENANLRSHIDVMDKALHPRRNSKKAPEPVPTADGARMET